MKLPIAQDKLLFDVLFKYCSLDIPEYQSYLVIRSTLAVSLAESFMTCYLMLFPRTPVKSVKPFQKNTIMKKLHLVLLVEDIEDKDYFIHYLEFINQIYNLHHNNSFLDTISKALFNIFLTSLAQEQILASSNLDSSRTAIQYLTLILEHISSPKFAKCITRFLFGLYKTESLSPFTEDQIEEDNEPQDTDENSDYLQTSLSEIIFFNDLRNPRIEPSLLTSKEYIESKHKVMQLREHVFKRLENGDIAVWQLMMMLFKYRLNSYTEMLCTSIPRYSRVRVYNT